MISRTNKIDGREVKNLAYANDHHSANAIGRNLGLKDHD